MRTTKSVILRARKKRLENSIKEDKMIRKMSDDLSKKYDFSSDNKRPRTAAEEKILEMLK